MRTFGETKFLFISMAYFLYISTMQRESQRQLKTLGFGAKEEGLLYTGNGGKY